MQLHYAYNIFLNLEMAINNINKIFYNSFLFTLTGVFCVNKQLICSEEYSNR